MGTALEHRKPARMYCGESFGYVPITIAADEELCPECEGLGAVWHDNGVGGRQKLSRDCCDNCNGAGVLQIGEAN